jgi:hypothetical protein
METTSVAAVAAPSGNVVDNAISKLLDGVIAQMFAPAKWERGTTKEGVVGMITHAKSDEALAQTEGIVVNIVTYSNGKSTFTPSAEVKTSLGIFLANVEGSLALKEGDKVNLLRTTYPDKKTGENVPCLGITKVITK